jgi:hypothetical protein
MTSDYDVIVVGARCAGSPTAVLLARLGRAFYGRIGMGMAMGLVPVSTTPCSVSLRSGSALRYALRPLPIN